MEKKKYTKPTIVKVKLSPEQAVLGICSASVTDAKDSSGDLCCGTPDCKIYRKGDSAATS